MNTNITNSVAKNIKLPYKVVKGSVASRDKSARLFTYYLAQEVRQKLAHQDISVACLRKILNDTKPKRIPLYVEVNEDPTAIASFSTFSEESSEKIVGYLLGVNLGENGKMSMAELPSLAHEFQHFADYLFHPKFVSREQALRTQGLYNEKYERFFDEKIYIEEFPMGKKSKKKCIKRVEHNILKFLRKLPIEDKINYLQYMRYSLIMEDKAYQVQNKVAKRLHKKNFGVYLDDLEKQNSSYMFKEKIDLLKKMIFSCIKKERDVYKINLKKNKQNIT